ncbi:hypothetical protein C4569_02465 [Candidatus Parcubacteria bacterium]|nr:MAG: hypothetical protein C4569_02465 [Candidatus Parcubacteria bacterium]
MIILRLVVLVIFLAVLFFMLLSLAYAGISAAPWVPLWKSDVRRMLKVARLKPGELLYDLGSGDGRMLIIAAREFKAKAVGYEISLLLYLISYIKIFLVNLRIENKIKINYSSFYSADLSQADVICAFLTPMAMKKLKNKFENELKPGCRIVSYAFSVPGWQAEIADKPNPKKSTVYLYTAK